MAICARLLPCRCAFLHLGVHYYNTLAAFLCCNGSVNGKSGFAAAALLTQKCERLHGVGLARRDGAVK